MAGRATLHVTAPIAETARYEIADVAGGHVLTTLTESLGISAAGEFMATAVVLLVAAAVDAFVRRRGATDAA